MANKYAVITALDMPMDPEVEVKGYGKMRLSKLKKQAYEKARAFAELVRKENFNMAAWLTHENNDTMIVFIRALDEIADDLESLAKLTKK